MLDAPGAELREAEVQRPEPGPGQVRIRIAACGVCRTDLHIRDGELPDPKLPLILGHQIVGTVVDGDPAFAEGTRVGVPWLGWTDGDAATAAAGAKTCATARSSPGTRSTGATPRRSSPMRATASHFPRAPPTWSSRRCSARV